MKAVNRKDKTDIFVPLFSGNGRDPEAIIPLVWYLKNVFGYNVQFGSLFDAYYLIDKMRPKVVLINNVVGSNFNFLVARYAYKKGIIVISLTSEGLFNPKEMNAAIWFYNPHKEIVWNKLFVWSDHYLKMTRDFLPQYSETFDTSGSTGLDRYKIYKFQEREEILAKYKKNQYKKVILYAGFLFTLFLDKNRSEKYNNFKNIKICKEEIEKVKEILKQLILKNKDILFILKAHPGEHSHVDIDFNWRYDNVLILEEQEALGDLISISDIFLNYDSTSSYEAYLLGKPAITLTPTDNNRKRIEVYKGNALVKNYTEAQRVITEYYATGKIKEFAEKKQIREQLIKKNLDAGDGLNSWRTAKKINDFLHSQKANPSVKTSFIGSVIHLLLKYNKILQVIPKYKHSPILACFNNLNQIYKLMDRYDPQIKRFYHSKIQKNNQK